MIRQKLDELLAGAKTYKPERKRSRTAQLVNMSRVEAKSVDWLWPNRIPRGMLTLIGGDPGLGKSMLTIDLAARVSTGRSWPDSIGEEREPGNVILISAEDDVQHVIRPRLDAAEADVSRVTAIEAVNCTDPESGEATERGFMLEDIPVLQDAIERVGDVRLIVIDPVTAYCGKSDTHKQGDVRALLAPLARLATLRNVAVVIVQHLNKAAGNSAMYRLTGSLAFIAAARAGWLVARDREQPDRRLWLPVKMNLCREPKGLAFNVEDDGNGCPFVAWHEGDIEVTADQALSGGLERDTPARTEAREWLLEALADGPVAVDELKAGAKEIGVSWRVVQLAKKRLKVRSSRQGFGNAGRWLWELAGDESHDADGDQDSIERTGSLCQSSLRPLAGAIKNADIAIDGQGSAAPFVSRPKNEGIPIERTDNSIERTSDGAPFDSQAVNGVLGGYEGGNVADTERDSEPLSKERNLNGRRGNGDDEPPDEVYDELAEAEAQRQEQLGDWTGAGFA